MAPKLAIRRLRVRELLLLVALAGMLAYAYIPLPAGRPPDPVADQIRLLQGRSPSIARTPPPNWREWRTRTRRESFPS